jgi:hypothetical protein
MTVGIQIVWWIGLIGALGITLIILREVELVVRSLRDILRLAEFTREAAKGIAANVEVIPGLANVAGPAQKTLESARKLAEASEAIRKKLDNLVPSSSH